MSLTGLAGCDGAAGAGPGGKSGRGRGGKSGRRGGPPQPLAVAVTQVEPANIEHRYRASGTLEPRRRAEIRPLRAGIIDSLAVEVGDTVEEGQLLARLDGRELALQARRDRIAAANAEAELERLESLAGSDAIASEEIDARRYELESARATARLSRTQASTMTVRAPFAGMVIAREVDVGNLAGTATVLYEIADTSALELDLHLPEREAAGVRVGTEVDIELVDGTTFSGTVVRRAPIVDALTGTVEFLVRAETYPALAAPGAFVRARVLLERREAAPSLPRRAVFELEGQAYVYVLREGKARREAVEIGLEGGERVEIASPLSPELPVLADAGGITEGLAVKAADAGDALDPAAAPASDAAAAAGGS